MTKTTSTRARRLHLLIAGAVACTAGVIGGAIGASPVSAASYTVTSEANSGANTLRQAIQDANANPGEDTITFAPNVHLITLTNNITITDDIRIEGPGRNALTLTNATSRIFDVNAGSLYIDSLTIDGAGSNAIIVTSPTGDVELDDMTISDSANHALNVVSAVNVTVTNTDLTNSKAAGFKGDGVHIESATGAVLIEDVVASGNEDNFEIASVLGTVTLRRVTATAAVDEAADFQTIGGLVIESSTFDANTDQVDVNVVNGSLSITDTTVSGTEIDDGLEISDVSGSAVVSRTTLSSNGMGGLFVSGETTPTTVTVVNSTISDNTKSGIIVSMGGTVAVQHSTIVDNHLRGVTLVLGGAVTATHTILTDNDDGAIDIVAGSAAVQYSLLPTGSGYTGSGNVATDDSLLGPLSDNGGPTETHLPMTGSPAINAGNPAISSPPSVDQRGLPRVVSTIDIGAVEVAATPPPNRGSVSILPISVNVSESVGTVPFTITRSGGTAGAVSVKVSTQNLSAAAPADYVALSQVVSFADGVGGSKTVNLTIVDDAKVEGSEALKVRLSQATGGVTIGTSQATVTIADNDTAPPPLDPELDAAGKFVALPPQRLFDTRPSEPAPGPKGKLGTGETIDVQITGVAGVPSNATAVVMNVTMTQSDAGGFVTVWGAGSVRPPTSNLNFTAPSQSRPNLVTVPIGVGGKVSMYASAPTHLLADVAGYYVDVDAAVAEGRFVSLAPKRVFDTRPGEPAPGPKGLIGAGQTIDVTIAGEGGLPSTGISAVVLNLTAAGASTNGFVTAYPTNVSRPTSSVVNMQGSGAVANLVVLPLGPDGMLRFYTSTSTHLLGDVMGYFTDGDGIVTTDGLFVPLAPDRVFDTRPAEAAPGPKGFVAANSSVDFVAAGVMSIPADAAAVVLNVTATQSAGAGNYVTGWPTGLDRPLASLLNLGASDTRPNATILAPGTGQKVSLYTLLGAHLLADSFGYYLG